jgi:hypothetical protein
VGANEHQIAMLTVFKRLNDVFAEGDQFVFAICGDVDEVGIHFCPIRIRHSRLSHSGIGCQNIHNYQLEDDCDFFHVFDFKTISIGFIQF